MALVLFFILMAIPGSALHYFLQLCLHDASATLPFSQLYQEWSAKIEIEEIFLVTPLSLLCGGLILGWLAPRYVSRKSVLLSAAAMGIAILVLSLAFTWTTSVYETNGLAASEGGWVARLSAPLSYIVRQTLLVAAWTTVCVLGATLGLRLRDRRPPMVSADTPPTLRTVSR